MDIEKFFELPPGGSGDGSKRRMPENPTPEMLKGLRTEEITNGSHRAVTPPPLADVKGKGRAVSLRDEADERQFPTMPNLSSEPSAFELEVVIAAERHEQKTKTSKGNYTRVFVLGNVLVKYSDHVFIMRECQALQSLYDLAIKGGDDAPRVPQVVHYLHRPNGLGYIIMECIHMRDVSEDELCSKAAEAVLWLHAQRMDLFGSLGGANTSHTVFQRGSAPHPFTSVAAAQTYLNEAVGRVRVRRPSRMKPIANIDLTDDNVVLTQSDMHPSNFGVALDDGRPVIFDAATIQALPKTLADFTLLRTTSFAKAVSAYVFHPLESNALLESPSFMSLASVRSHLNMGNDDLGVDKDGNVTPTRRTRTHR